MLILTPPIPNAAASVWLGGSIAWRPHGFFPHMRIEGASYPLRFERPVLVWMKALQDTAATVRGHRTGRIDTPSRWFDDFHQPALGESMAASSWQKAYHLAGKRSLQLEKAVHGTNQRGTAWQQALHAACNQGIIQGNRSIGPMVIGSGERNLIRIPFTSRKASLGSAMVSG